MSTDVNNLAKSTTEKYSKDIDLLALVLVVLRGWKVIVFFTLLGLLIAVLYSRYENPTFKSTALIQITEKSKGISALGTNISDLVGDDVSKADAEAELIKSHMVLKPVVDLLHLSIRLSDPEISALDRIKADRTPTQINVPEGVSLKTEDGQVQISQFNVSQGYLNQSFTLTKSNTGFALSNGFDDFKGQLNQAHYFKGLDGIIQITVNELPHANHPITIVKKSLPDTVDSINSTLVVAEKVKQTGIVQLSLTGANQQQVSLILKEIIQSYINQNQSQGSEEINNTLTFMDTQIPVLQKKLEDSETTFNNFREKYGTIDISQEAGLLVTENSQIDAQINELELKKVDLTTYYTEEHPLVLKINDQLKVLVDRKQQINTNINKLPKVQREFLKLSADTEINREIYLTMLKNYEQLKIVRAGQIGYARIIDLPVSTFRAIAPKKQLIIMSGTILGLIIGAMLVLFKNMLRNPVKDPEHLELKTGVPVIATIPRSALVTRLSKNKKAPNRLLAYTDANSLSYEAIKSLRTHLMFGMPKQGKNGQRARVILISGESPGVGKSFISSNLSEVIAQLNQKVLIIDADMRLGELHKVFSMEQKSGLADYLSQVDDQDGNSMLADNTLSNFVHPTTLDNIDFMPRGQQPHNPTTLLASDRFSKLMDQLGTYYDFIILDSPPILAASDASLLSQYADKLLMVTRYDKSIEGQLVYALNQLNKDGITVDGIVINDMQQGIMNKYSYHYSYAYGNNK